MRGRASCLEIFRQMTRIRRFEERCAELYTESKIRGFLHLYIGEEAVASAIIPQLRPEDAIVATYREHGHILVRGTPMDAVMAEMFGKIEGCSKGRGGSMHLYDAGRRFYGGNAIVGGGLPLSTGLALADRMQGRKNVTACFFGEGAMAEGEFHESMNLAALWELPVLFLCENNLYAMGTRIDRSEAEVDLLLKARSYHVEAATVDGMDPLAVAEAAEKAIRVVREEARPYFLECRTYRFRAHSMFDPDLYRDKKEIEEWKKKDPLPAFETFLKMQGWLDEAASAAMKKKIDAEIEASVKYAEEGTLEPVEDLIRDVVTPHITG
ncbi:MAG TPA: pyruvate dehydrogenase (acetyl-transferring) E1 component subunit alpha [bacterium]|nr:pyruvate dehydrogenase (acetyl-transferring) E1 component subunit alpha [bacterium]